MSDDEATKVSKQRRKDEFYSGIALQDTWDPFAQMGYPAAMAAHSRSGVTARVWLYGTASGDVPDKTVCVRVSRTEVGEMIRLLKQLQRHMKSLDKEQDEAEARLREVTGNASVDICPLGTTCVHDAPVKTRKIPLPTLTEAYQTGYDAGYGAAAAVILTAYPAPERAILTDLIAELRGQANIWQEGDINEDRWDYPAMMLRAHADRAEARLREVTGDVR